MSNLPTQMDPYGSHLPALLACVAATGGPVLEVGIGNYSTPVLHAVCEAQNRFLISAESDRDWFDKLCPSYGRLGSRHFFVHSPDWSNLCELANHQWSVVFLDHGPSGSRRGPDAELFWATTDYVVIHDYDAYDVRPGVDTAQRLYQYQAVSKLLSPWTVVLGRIPIPEIL